VPSERQTLLFSATMPTAIGQIAATYMKLPLRIEVAPAGTPAAHIEQHVYFTLNESKMQMLDKILSEHTGPILIFSRTKHGAKKIAMNVRAMGHEAAEIHSNLSTSQRREALNGFKTGKYRVLVATDIAARGIDVNNISLVINYDLPGNSEDYVHRIGRTGRAGKEGKAISFAAPSEWPDIANIEKLIRKKINVADTPVLPPRRHNATSMAERPAYGQRGRRPGFSGGRPAAPRRPSAPRRAPASRARKVSKW
jgi:ATP-dependent RNA helicase RhlE